MAALKRNIWALYLLIVLLGAAILTAVLYQRWHSIVSDEAMYQVSRAKLVHQSVNSFLHTQELVLDVIGRELLDSPGILEGQRAIPLLDSILSVNPTLVGSALPMPMANWSVSVPTLICPSCLISVPTRQPPKVLPSRLSLTIWWSAAPIMLTLWPNG
ncbi:hypothetical protein [Marinobacter fuscus]|uniref:hypothetical protein n=1 Tax=Marinobacter fuscus TaxID=2109942 RepID=UPI001F0B93B5|nr:hypothetical protein [Marinobacter fuscus]